LNWQNNYIIAPIFYIFVLSAVYASMKLYLMLSVFALVLDCLDVSPKRLPTDFAELCIFSYFRVALLKVVMES